MGCVVGVLIFYMSLKRERVVITIEGMLAAIDQVKNGKHFGNVADDFGFLTHGNFMRRKTSLKDLFFHYSTRD